MKTKNGLDIRVLTLAGVSAVALIAAAGAAWAAPAPQTNYSLDLTGVTATVANQTQYLITAGVPQLNTGDVKTFDAFFAGLKPVLRDTFGAERFDFLVNNAGTALYSPFAETTEEQFDTAMNIHYKGVFFFTQKALPLLNDGGRIINISSGLARFAFVGSSAYGSMKGAIEVLTRYLAKELGPRGIAVNTVAPGAIATDFGGGSVWDNKQLNDFVASVTALGRVGLPDDIGPAIANLLTDENGWINAQRIEVSGGMFV